MNRVKQSLLTLCVFFSVSCIPPVRTTDSSADLSSYVRARAEPVSVSVPSVRSGTVPCSMKSADITFQVLVPDVAGILKSFSGVPEGHMLPSRSILGTTVAFRGENLSDGVRYTGTFADGSGTITLEVNHVSMQFRYEQKLFLDDPHKALPTDNGYASKTVQYLEMEGTLDPEYCGAATLVTGFFSRSEAGTALLAVVKEGEYYTGKWNSSDETVTGIAFNRQSSTTAPERTYGGVPQPPEPLNASDIEGTVAYIKAYIASNPDDIPQYSLLYRRSGDPHPRQHLCGLWDRATISSPASAKACLPSPAWRNVSRLDTY